MFVNVQKLSYFIGVILLNLPLLKCYGKGSIPNLNALTDPFKSVFPLFCGTFET
jgi:hypothetical protein